ncbi:hypothetical protein NITGR_220015 [Nitrospina gracilis 3/211]|uniref:Uncharacterized protein n=1 Tax=Nitrospina gracilis (strain 3/211) TaxID=1266370 RepID=M1YX44_NITG3|nr:hypothetical protein NITGR_220015 [Nitrospina gracilis 3/211]
MMEQRSNNIEEWCSQQDSREAARYRLVWLADIGNRLNCILFFKNQSFKGKILGFSPYHSNFLVRVLWLSSPSSGWGTF